MLLQIRPSLSCLPFPPFCTCTQSSLTLSFILFQFVHSLARLCLFRFQVSVGRSIASIAVSWFSSEQRIAALRFEDLRRIHTATVSSSFNTTIIYYRWQYEKLKNDQSWTLLLAETSLFPCFQMNISPRILSSVWNLHSGYKCAQTWTHPVERHIIKLSALPKAFMTRQSGNTDTWFAMIFYYPLTPD